MFYLKGYAPTGQLGGAEIETFLFTIQAPQVGGLEFQLINKS